MQICPRIVAGSRINFNRETAAVLELPVYFLIRGVLRHDGLPTSIDEFLWIKVAGERRLAIFSSQPLALLWQDRNPDCELLGIYDFGELRKLLQIAEANGIVAVVKDSPGGGPFTEQVITIADLLLWLSSMT